MEHLGINRKRSPISSILMYIFFSYNVINQTQIPLTTFCWKKLRGIFFFHLLLMIGMLRQRFCCWRASHKIRHEQNKHIIEKTNKQNTKQLIFNFLILNALNVIIKSILVVLFSHDCLYLSTGKRISDSDNEFNAKKDAYCTKKWISF